MKFLSDICPHTNEAIAFYVLRIYNFKGQTKRHI